MRRRGARPSPRRAARRARRALAPRPVPRRSAPLLLRGSHAFCSSPPRDAGSPTAATYLATPARAPTSSRSWASSRRGSSFCSAWSMGTPRSSALLTTPTPTLPTPTPPQKPIRQMTSAASPLTQVLQPVGAAHRRGVPGRRRHRRGGGVQGARRHAEPVGRRAHRARAGARRCAAAAAAPARRARAPRPREAGPPPPPHARAPRRPLPSR